MEAEPAQLHSVFVGAASLAVAQVAVDPGVYSGRAVEGLDAHLAAFEREAIQAVAPVVDCLGLVWHAVARYFFRQFGNVGITGIENYIDVAHGVRFWR